MREGTLDIDANGRTLSISSFYIHGLETEIWLMSLFSVLDGDEREVRTANSIGD